jgi:multiple sugar transport system permease protein
MTVSPSVEAASRRRFPLVPRSPRKQTASHRLAGWSFAAPLVLVLVLIVGAPVVYAVQLSFTDSSDIGTDVASFVGLDNYRRALGDPALVQNLLNTVVWTVGSLGGQLGLGLVAALAVNRKTRGVGFFRVLFIVPYVVPAVALAMLVKWLLDSRYGLVSYGLQDLGLLPADQTPLSLEGWAMPTVILANIWRGFPFAMLIYWAALQGIDQALYDAAQVDGANPLQEFWHVTLPGLRDATAALLVLRGIWSATYFDIIYLTTGGGPLGSTETWPIWIYREAVGQFDTGFASAVAVMMAVALLAIIALYVRASRYGKES